jgi:hypothetical protein
MTMGTPNCAGSSGLCPPAGTRLPPTNATDAKRIDRSQFADRVQQNNLAGSERFRTRAAWDFQSDRLTQERRRFSSAATALEALRMPGRENHYQPRIGFKQERPGFKMSAASSPSRCFRPQSAQTRRQLFNRRVASASTAARTSNFRLPATDSAAANSRLPSAARHRSRSAPAPG